jgi:tetratricopeptide (TPR) repeat protein
MFGVRGVNIKRRLLNANQRVFHVITRRKSPQELHALTDTSHNQKSPNMRVNQLIVICRELRNRNEVIQERAVAAELLGLAHGSEKLSYKSMVSALSCVADSYVRFREYENAVSLRDELVLIEQGRHGPSSPETIDSLVRLIVDLRKAGDLDRVVILERQMLDISINQSGLSSPTTLGLRTQLGADLSQLGNYAESGVELNTVAALLDISTADGMKARIWLAKNLATEGDFAGALQIREEILEERRRRLGAEDRETLIAIEYVAAMHLALGDRNRAKDLLESALASRERLFGDADPQTQTAKSRLAEHFGPFD